MRRISSMSLRKLSGNRPAEMPAGIELQLAKLTGLIAKDAPFGKASPRDGRLGVHWVRPELVARVAFRERTKDGLMRHTTFQGLRLDVLPSSIVREANN
jgi:ATP-dependent DNA ligase